MAEVHRGESRCLPLLGFGQGTNLPRLQLASYKVKCMLAEPKGKRNRQEFSGCSDPASPSYQVPHSASPDPKRV